MTTTDDLFTLSGEFRVANRVTPVVIEVLGRYDTGNVDSFHVRIDCGEKRGRGVMGSPIEYMGREWSGTIIIEGTFVDGSVTFDRILFDFLHIANDWSAKVPAKLRETLTAQVETMVTDALLAYPHVYANAVRWRADGAVKALSDTIETLRAMVRVFEAHRDSAALGGPYLEYPFSSSVGLRHANGMEIREVKVPYSPRDIEPYVAHTRAMMAGVEGVKAI